MPLNNPTTAPDKRTAAFEDIFGHQGAARARAPTGRTSGFSAGQPFAVGQPTPWQPGVVSSKPSGYEQPYRVHSQPMITPVMRSMEPMHPMNNPSYPTAAPVAPYRSVSSASHATVTVHPRQAVVPPPNEATLVSDMGQLAIHRSRRADSVPESAAMQMTTRSQQNTASLTRDPVWPGDSDLLATPTPDGGRQWKASKNPMEARVSDGRTRTMTEVSLPGGRFLPLQAKGRALRPMDQRRALTHHDARQFVDAGSVPHTGASTNWTDPSTILMSPGSLDTYTMSPVSKNEIRVPSHDMHIASPLSNAVRTLSPDAMEREFEKSRTEDFRVIPNATALRQSDTLRHSTDMHPLDSLGRTRPATPGDATSTHSSTQLSRNSSFASMGQSIANGLSSSSRHGEPFQPSLLSSVAKAFADVIVTGERTRNGVVYEHAFDGQQAVDRLAELANTSDRNLALLLGRALDAQKFFHDVMFEHRLRDSVNELYQFDVPRIVEVRRSIQSERSNRTLMSRLGDETDSDASMDTPTGVFTLLTNCYSPTCSREHVCYSITCPRRLGQVPTLRPSTSVDESHGPVDINSQLWAESVPRDLYESVTPRERKRQEVIFEIISTERAYVEDLEYLRDLWIQPLSTQHILPEARRAKFVKTVFFNLMDILPLNQRLVEMLTRRQRQRPVVEYIGDFFQEVVPTFEPYVAYGANQTSARLALEAEKESNPVFAIFAEETQRKARSRKLELNGYLTKPTTRLARYPLLFEQLLKYTDDENMDALILPRVVQQIRNLLSRVNDETGRTVNRLELTQLSQQLVFKPGEMVDLRLGEDGRELVFKSSFRKRSGMQSDNSEIQVLLFDHALLMIKQKVVHKNEMLKVYRRPIPLEFLRVTVYEDIPGTRGTRTRLVHSRSSIGKRTIMGPGLGQSLPRQDAKTGYAITFTHLGKEGYSLTLWSTTQAARTKWLEYVEARQDILRTHSNVFDLMPVVPQITDSLASRLTCAVPFDFGRQVFLGKDDGVYIGDMRERGQTPLHVLPLLGVTQIDVIEEHQILIVLADQYVYTFTLDALDPADPMTSLKRGRRISSHTSFFRVGVCLGRTLVCVVKSGPVSSTIKTLEPIEQTERGKRQPTFRKLLQGGQDTLRVFKEFYIPTESSSIHFLKSKLCVGTAKGFEIVDLETLDTQGVLDPADLSLDFVHRRQNLKPIAIYRIDGEFLLCYNEFAFYVNKNGWRARSNWIIYWEGNPTAFALHYPYVLAFEPTFIEVRHVETGALHQIITGFNLRCLFADAVHTTPSSIRALRLQRQRHPSTVIPSSPFGSMSEFSSHSLSSPRGTVPVANWVPSSTSKIAPNSVAAVPPHVSSPSGISSPGTQMSFSNATVLDSVLLSRGHIVFVGDSSMYCVRFHHPTSAT